MPSNRSGGKFNAGDSSLPRTDFVDVSSHNGTISVDQFNSMKNYGVKGVVVKLTEGTYYQNPFAASQINNARAAGLKVSAYHFSQFATTSAAVNEANYFISFARELGLGADTVMVNDFESPACLGSTDGTGLSNAFSNQLKANGFGTVVHYCSGSVFSSGKLNSSGLNGDKTWTAGYPVSPSINNLQYTNSSAWQWASTVTFPNIGGTIDCSIDYSGVFTNSSITAPDGTVAVYRLYNRNSSEHFYTSAQAEINNLVSKGWNYEGFAWFAPTQGTTIYRLYNPNAGDHHYTLTMAERNNLVSHGWNYEGTAWNSDPAQGTTIYRLYNPNARGAGAHHYTASLAEVNSLTRVGWNYEGIGWYGAK